MKLLSTFILLPSPLRTEWYSVASPSEHLFHSMSFPASAELCGLYEFGYLGRNLCWQRMVHSMWGAVCLNGKTSCSNVKRNKTLTNTVVFIETCSVVTLLLLDPSYQTVCQVVPRHILYDGIVKCQW